MAEALKGRRVVVVGASSGIGRAAAVAAVNCGADVVFVGRRAHRLDEAVAEAGSGVAVAADIADAEECESLVRQAVDALGAIDVLLFSAGVSGLGFLRDTDQQEWHRIFDVNVIGPALVTRAALAHLSEDAVVAFLSSDQVGQPREGLGPYSASKAALDEMILAWREEHPELRFCCLCVGPTEGTEFARDMDPELAGALFPKWIGLGRLPAQMMSVDAVADAILHTLVAALDHRELEVQRIVIRPPGLPMEAGVDRIIEHITDAAAKK